MNNMNKYNKTSELFDTPKSTSKSTYMSTTVYKLIITGFIGIVLIFISLSGVLLASVYTGNGNTSNEIEESQQTNKNINDSQEHQESQYHNEDTNSFQQTNDDNGKFKHSIHEGNDKVPGETKYNFDEPVDELVKYNGPVRHILSSLNCLSGTCL